MILPTSSNSVSTQICQLKLSALQLLETFYKLKDAFAKSVSDLKAYNKQEFELDLKPNSRLVFQKQFRHKPEHAKILQHQIDAWRLGEARHCHSFKRL